MSVSISGSYVGDLTCEAVHDPSGHSLTTTAPKDNGGSGDLFSPTDLVAAAVGNCILTVLGLWAKRRDIDLSGSSYTLTKEMVSQPKRRIGLIRMTFRLPTAIPEKLRGAVIKVAEACPVKASLHPEVTIEMDFVYE